jgi:hypothetical protein
LRHPTGVGSARILIVMAAHWPRALLRAELREAGYDALGARDFDEAMSYPKEEAGRGPVRLLILDQAALEGGDDPRLKELLRRHGKAETLLIAGAFQPPSPGQWRQVLRHPKTIAEIIQAAEQLLPPPTAAHPLD